MNQLFDGINGMGLGIFALVAIPFAIIALILVGAILRARRKVQASKHWTIASGRVVRSYVEPRRHHSSHGGTTTAFYPVVVYEYGVGGQQFQSNRVRFGLEYGSGSTGMAQNVVNKYPSGSLVQVFYNPVNPAEAVLEQTARGSNRILTCVVVVIVLTLATTFAMTFGGFALVQQLVGSLGSLPK